MRTIATLFAMAALGAISTQPSHADCVELNSGENQQARAGLSKDGTHAPMENKNAAQEQPGPAAGTTTSATNSASGAPQKDGGNMPMGENPDVATSGQDAQAQQQGDKTAAATANDKKC